MAVPWWWFEMRAALDAAGSSTLMPQSFVEILRAHRDGKCGMDPGMIGRPAGSLGARAARPSVAWPS